MHTTEACVLLTVLFVVACDAEDYDIEDSVSRIAVGGTSPTAGVEGSQHTGSSVGDSHDQKPAEHAFPAAGFGGSHTDLDSARGLARDGSIAGAANGNGGASAMQTAWAAQSQAGLPGVAPTDVLGIAGCAGNPERPRLGSGLGLPESGGLITNDMQGSVYYVPGDSLMVVQALGESVSGIGASTCAPNGASAQVPLRGCGDAPCTTDADCASGEACVVESSRASDRALGIGRCDPAGRDASLPAPEVPGEPFPTPADDAWPPTEGTPDWEFPPLI